MAVAAINPILPAGASLCPVLAQAARAARVSNDIWFYLIVLVIASVTIIVIGLIARKMLGGPIDSGGGESVFDLSELRRLHREGHLTDEEFQAARAAVLMDGAGMLGDTAGPANAPQAAPGSHDIELGPELLDGSDPTDGPYESDKPGPDA